MKKLTPKQEKFAQLYVELGNASEAYRQAYDVKENTKDETIWKRSSELLGTGAVSGRIDNLKKELANDNKITKQKIIDYHLKMVNAWEELWALGKEEGLTKEQKTRFYLLKEMVKGSDYRGSLDSITKMTGLNEPEKIEVKDTSFKTKWG